MTPFGGASERIFNLIHPVMRIDLLGRGSIPTVVVFVTGQSLTLGWNHVAHIRRMQPIHAISPPSLEPRISVGLLSINGGIQIFVFANI